MKVQFLTSTVSEANQNSNEKLTIVVTDDS